MMLEWSKKGLLCLSLILMVQVAWAAKGPAPMTEDKQHINNWTKFFNSLVKIHEWRQNNYEIKEVVTKGGYAGMPDFYDEISYYDKKSNRLLSRIKWEKEKKNTIHTIEVYVYDKQGRVERDYLAAYLPEFRNAPVQTLINFHHYNDELHSFRQFDASGYHIYEQCQGEYFSEDVMISIDEDDFETAVASEEDKNPTDKIAMETYLACFEMLPKELGQYKNPVRAEALESKLQASRSQVDLDTYEGVSKRIARLTDRLLQSPNNADLYVQRGEAYFFLHENESAVSDYNQALQIDSDSSQAWFGRGMAYGRMGEIDKGIADLSKFIKRNPRSSLGYTKRGVRYIWKGDKARAEQDLSKAIELDSKNAEAHDDLGVIYAQRGEIDKAIHHFSTTVSVDPSYFKGYHNLAMVHHIKGEHQQALDYTDKVLVLRSDERTTLLLKSQILAAMGQHQQASMVKDQAEFLPEGNWSERAPSH